MKQRKAKAKRVPRGPAKRKAQKRPAFEMRARQRACALQDETPSVVVGETRWPKEISLKRVVRRRDLGDIEVLAKSIDDRNCLLQPVVITVNNELIAGQRRLAAWAASKFANEPIPVHVVAAIDSILAGEWDENAQRKEVLPSEAVDLMEALLPQVRAAAAARQRGGVLVADGEKGQARDHVAHYLGRDHKTLAKAKEVVEAAREEPAKFGDLLAAMDKTGKVNGPWRRLNILRQVEAIAQNKANGTLTLPGGRYDRIVADMPWPHEIDDPDPAAHGRATRDYPTMALAAMKAMPIGKRAAKNCVLYMWVTSFHMRYAYEVMDAWGFTHAPVILTWVKDKIGKGQRLREQTEHCIIAIKGKPTWNLTNQSTRLDAGAREDARKPDEFYALVDALTPGERGLELFARRELPAGWDGFGDEVGKFKRVEGQCAAALLTVLEAIERGEPMEFNDQYHGWRGLFAGKRKRKLTKAGQARLVELRDEAAEAAELAALPDDIEKLIELYRAALRSRDDAAYHSDRDAAERVARDTRQLDLIQTKANGGLRVGAGDAESPAELLRRETAAPLGEVPMWGQYGLFRMVIDGVPYIVAHADHISFEVYAEDRTKPFISETGYRSIDPLGGIALGVTVAEQAGSFIREEIALPLSRAGSRREKRKKGDLMPLPEKCYRLPASWDEVWADSHVVTAIPIDDDDRAKRSPLRVAARATEAGHVVAMTLDHVDASTSFSVATCQCGWTHRVRRTLESAAAQDAAVASHWRVALAAIGKGRRKDKPAEVPRHQT